jgi:3-hydroxybutyryl-CoA dehydrogenase
LEDDEVALVKIGVLGAGVMGAGIAQVAAAAGYQVAMNDIEQRFIDSAIMRMEKGLTRQVEKGKLTVEAKTGLLNRITTSTDLGALSDADLIIEAVLEDLDAKVEIFKKLDSVCKPESIFASNTSSISISLLAKESGRPESFLGLHFFNPAPVMKLVEVISAESTAPHLIDQALEFVSSLGKTPVHVKKDSPGFIVNRLLVPYLNEAVRLYEEGAASFEDIDKAVKLGLNYPMGPFQMLDMGGVDLTVTTLSHFSKEFDDKGYAPRPELLRRLKEGKLGMKSGEGFYNYNSK